jgi:hypothetical protein
MLGGSGTACCADWHVLQQALCTEAAWHVVLSVVVLSRDLPGAGSRHCQEAYSRDTAEQDQ